ncbi:MAG: hypothetical protein MPL62_04665 [Alphaproteobacteria bacterium]|nr:hypothetical protein [Alphaproteobacteria bacterium]
MRASPQKIKICFKDFVDAAVILSDFRAIFGFAGTNLIHNQGVAFVCFCGRFGVMQVISGAPNVPDRLLHAHEEGQAVFFCGADVSVPAGLPPVRPIRTPR